MDRATCEQVGEQMMTMALDNLVRDGYVAFATLLLSPEGELTPLLLETVSDESKDKLAVMLRALAPHLSAIVVISEAWTLEDSAAINALGPNNRVADDPQRKEGVFVQVASQQVPSALRILRRHGSAVLSLDSKGFSHDFARVHGKQPPLFTCDVWSLLCPPSSS